MDADLPTLAVPDNATEWLAHAADLLGAEASCLLAFRPDVGHRLIADGLDERAIAEYRDHFHCLDPLPALLAARPAGRALVIDTTTHPAYVAQRELSARYLRPHGIGCVIVVQWWQPDGSQRFVGVQRFRGSAPFTMADGKELDRIIHHWRVGNAMPPPQGFAARSAGGGGDARRSCDIAAQLDIPLAVVDAHLAILWANPAAQEEQGSVWTALFDGRTKYPANFHIRRNLLELVRICLGQRAEAEYLLPAADGTWFATAAPLQGKPGLALLRLTAVHRLGRCVRGRLQRLFGLTPAEAEMTALLAMGESLESIALARGVGLETIRTQLRTVFKKTGMHRQAELVSVVGKLARG